MSQYGLADVHKVTAGLALLTTRAGGHRESNQRMEDPVCWEAMVKGKRSGKPHGAWRPVGQRVWLRPHGEGAADGGAHLQGENTYISQ